MKHTPSTLAAAAVISFALCGPAFAADAPKPADAPQAKTPVVIVVDVNRIMTESAAAKSVQAQVTTLRKSLKSDVDQKESGLRAEDEKLGKERGTLSADDFAKKGQAFQDEVAQSRKDLDGRVAALDKAVNVAMGKIEGRLQQILFEIAKEQHANLVLPKAAILVAETGMDFTDQAMAKINAQLPSVKVDVQPVAAAPAK